ncbi:unnamed protein product [Musa acuminata subsp. burmannicoides]
MSFLRKHIGFSPCYNFWSLQNGLEENEESQRKALKPAREQEGESDQTSADLGLSSLSTALSNPFTPLQISAGGFSSDIAHIPVTGNPNAFALAPSFSRLASSSEPSKQAGNGEDSSQKKHSDGESTSHTYKCLPI